YCREPVLMWDKHPCPTISNKRPSSRWRFGSEIVTNWDWSAPGRTVALTKVSRSWTFCSKSKQSCENTNGGAFEQSRNRGRIVTGRRTDFFGRPRLPYKCD